MENEQVTDPYELVLADLRAQRAKLDNTISMLESVRNLGLAQGGAAIPTPPAPTQSEGGNRPPLGPGAFFGITVADAGVKLLASQRRQMQTSEITSELERGGIVLASVDKVNTVGSILLRRFNEEGDIVGVA